MAAAWAPDAERVDQVGVDRARVDVAARAGLLGATAPAAHGGGGAPPAVGRAVTELLAGACGATWFVTAQHVLPDGAGRRVAAAGRGAVGRGRWPGGQTLAATAVAHLRRGGAPPVRGGAATATAGAWTARSGGSRRGGSRTCSCSAPAPGTTWSSGSCRRTTRTAWSRGEPMRLAAMQGTRTTTLALDGYRLAARRRGRDGAGARLAAGRRGPHGQRRAGGLRAAGLALPARWSRSSGAARCRAGGRRGAAGGGAGGVAAPSGPTASWTTCRPRTSSRSGSRCGRSRCTCSWRTSGALVAAWAGAAMSLDHPAQRWAREALFHLVQAQTGPVREATLRRWDEGLSAPGRAPSPTR